MNAVRDLVELFPIPILIRHGSGHGVGIPTRRARRKDRAGEFSCQQLLTLDTEAHPIRGQRAFRLNVELLTESKEIDEAQVTLGGGLFDCLGIESEVGIHGLGAWSALRGRAFLEGQRRQQHQLRGGLTVILLLRRMLEPTRELFLKSR